MNKTVLAVIVINLALGGTLLGQGTSHMIIGSLRNSDGAIPESICVLFTAYVEGRPGDIINQSTPGNGYAMGNWGINTSAFNPTPSQGARIFLSFSDTCRREIGFDTVVVDYSQEPYQIADTTRLSAAAVVRERVPGKYTIALFPNPFNSTLNIVLNYPQEKNLKVVIYDVLGREVRSLYNDKFSGGELKIVWDGKDYEGHFVPSGVYFLDVRGNSKSFTRKVVYLR